MLGKKEKEAKRPSADRRQWLVHGGGIPQLHVGGTIACTAAAEGQQSSAQRHGVADRIGSMLGAATLGKATLDQHHEIKKGRM